MSKPDMSTSEPAMVLASSGWSQQEVVLEQRRHAPGMYSYGPFAHHLISIHIGAPLTLEHTCAGQHHTAIMRAGSVAVVPAGRATWWRHTDTAEFLTLQMSPVLLGRVAVHDSGGTGDQLELAGTFATHDPRLQVLAQLLATELRIDLPNGPLYAESLATAISVHLVRNYGQRVSIMSARLSPMTATQLQRVVAYLHEHFTHDITLSELSKLAGLSPNYLISQFRQFTGLPPHQYLIKLRVERARQLLTHGTTSISDVAAAVGFVDQSHLTRHMVRLDGVTPAAFRKRQRRNVQKTL